MKKVKLFTTIASLCLAVALMAFGVYAAANVNATVTSTVKVEANGISGTWKVNNVAVEDGDTVAAPNSISADDGSIVYTVTFEAGEGVDHTASVKADLDDETYFAVNTVKGTGDTWTITVTLTDAAKGGKLTASQTAILTITCEASVA